MTARPGTQWYSPRDDQRRRVRLSGVTVPRELVKAVRAEAGCERGAMSRAVCEALAAWLAQRGMSKKGGE